MTARARCEGEIAPDWSTTPAHLTQPDVPHAFLPAGGDFLAQEGGDGNRGRRDRTVDRRGEYEFARHRLRDDSRFQPPVRDLAVDRRGRQQREAEAFLDETREHAERIRFELDVELDLALGRRMLDQRTEAVGMTGQHQPLPQQPADIDALLAREAAAARTHRDDVVATEALHVEMQIGGAAVEDGEIHLAAVQPFDEMAAVALDDAQRNAGKFLDAAPREARRQHAAHGRDQAEHDLAGRRPLGRLDVVADLVDLPHDAGGARQQQAAGIREHHAAAVAGEQFRTQFVFQELDLPGERRLRHTQRVGCLGEAAELRHATEGPELTEIHACQSWKATPYAIANEHRGLALFSQRKRIGRRYLNCRTYGKPHE